MLDFKNYIITVVILLFCYTGVVHAGTPPPNDDCASAISITSDGDTPFDTTFATTDGPADSLCDYAGYSQVNQDIWYSYTASCTGILTVSICNQANFDTKLAFYDGISCDATDLGNNILACNDDFGGCGSTSELAAPVVSGQQYLIRVGGYDGASGSGTLSIACGPNECAGPTALDVPSSTLGSTTGGIPPIAPSCGPNFSLSSPGVWYTVTGTGNMMTASTCNPISNFDTQLAVYCNGCDTLTCIDGNDDAIICAEPSLSTVTWCSESGATYQILVHGFSSTSGDFQLDISDDGVSCSTDPQCAPIGACCSADVCSLVTADACGGGGGTYQGDGTTCQDVTCGGPGGACEEAQIAVQDEVGNEDGNYRNHGKYVRAAAHEANQFDITEECHSCIVSQFARNIPIGEQEVCTDSGP
jgi:hypothetical protein